MTLSQVNIKSVARTAFLPGIIPRVRSLTKNSFSTLAWLMAMLYKSVRLLDEAHPYVNPANYGRFGVIDVIIAAAANLKFSRKHIDQITIFSVILIGFFLLVGQAGLFIFMLIFNTAWAQMFPDMATVFGNPNPGDDIAFRILDQVFGVPGIYGSMDAPAGPGDISPFQAGLHGMFAFYSFLMLGIGIVIFLYYILVTMYETAQSGVPFGQRFDTVWAPIRLVVALGLLVPFGLGLNSAQYIVLYAAKYGSNVATNGWNTFHDTLVTQTSEDSATPFGYASLAGEEIIIYKDNISGSDIATDSIIIDEEEARYRRTMIALPKMGDTRALANSLLLVQSCLYIYREIKRFGSSQTLINRDDITVYLVSNEENPVGEGKMFLKGSEVGDTSYIDIREMFGSDAGDITLRFGLRDVERYPDYAGNVKPLCGEITIPVTDISSVSESSGNVLSPAEEFQKSLFSDLFSLLDFEDDLTNTYGSAFGKYWAERGLQEIDQQDRSRTAVEACENFDSAPPFVNFGSVRAPVNQSVECSETPLPDNNFFSYYKEDFKVLIARSYWDLYAAALGLGGFEGIDISMQQEVLDKGWGGAAIWYNKIAEINGMLVTAGQALPKMSRMPSVMLETLEKKEQAENRTQASSTYEPVIYTKDGSRPAFEAEPQKQIISKLLNDVYEYTSDNSVPARGSSSGTGMFFTVLNFLLGPEGLYTIRENIQVHPLAQLSALGRSMIDAAIRNLFISAGAGIFGGAMEVLINQSFGEALQNISGFFAAFVSISLALGIVLYYVVPFMPFLFFFFAMLSWIKTIFEAMVGVPLWALTHLRIDDPGLVTNNASSGYYLIFDIFLRPFLILTGLIAASIIFFTEVYLLHIVYDLVVENLAGTDPNCLRISSDAPDTYCPQGGTMADQARSHVDAFFFTVMYTIIVYIMANSTFKLVDRIPASILRWMGGDAQTFSDNSGDPTQNLTRNVALGGRYFGQQISGVVPEATGGAGRTVGGLFSRDGTNNFGGGSSGGRG